MIRTDLVIMDHTSRVDHTLYQDILLTLMTDVSQFNKLILSKETLVKALA